MKIAVTYDNGVIFQHFGRTEHFKVYEIADNKVISTGIIDANGNLFIRGRCKNMILGASGQNIYPEEIENYVLRVPYIQEAIVKADKNQLNQVIYNLSWERNKWKNEGEDVKNQLVLKNVWKLSDEKLTEVMKENLKELNTLIPAYSQVSTYKIYNEEFEKTPKRSIKRFLYQ